MTSRGVAPSGSVWAWARTKYRSSGDDSPIAWGFSSLDAHPAGIANRNVAVRSGRSSQFVARGAAGRSTGSHLHYETRIDGDAVDPQKFLRAGVRLSSG